MEKNSREKSTPKNDTHSSKWKDLDNFGKVGLFALILGVVATVYTESSGNILYDIITGVFGTMLFVAIIGIPVAWVKSLFSKKKRSLFNDALGIGGSVLIVIFLASMLISYVLTLNAATEDVTINEETVADEYSIEELTEFLLLFEQTAGLLDAEYYSFAESATDPKLQSQYMQGGSDVPLMRFLGRRGLNSLEINEVVEKIQILKDHKLSTEFSESVEKLDKGYLYLEKFYSNIETLQSFEQFQLYTADFLTYHDLMEQIADTFQLEYEYFRSSYPDLNYQMTDSIAGIIVELYDEDGSISLNPMDLTYFEAPIVFTGNVSPDTTQIIVTAKYGGKTDVYTLEKFTTGDRTFEYQAAEKYNNLAPGENTYFFDAYFSDGTSRRGEKTIYYYQ